MNETTLVNEAAPLFHSSITPYVSALAVMISAILAGCIAGWGIARQRETARNKNTIDFETSLEKEDRYTECFDIMRDVATARKAPKLIPVWHWAHHPASRQHKAIRHVLNTWERAANAVEKKVYSEDLLNDVYRSHVISIYEILLPYIEERRRIHSNSHIYTKFTSMGERWKTKRQINQDKARAKRIVCYRLGRFFGHKIRNERKQMYKWIGNLMSLIVPRNLILKLSKRQRAFGETKNSDSNDE